MTDEDVDAAISQLRSAADPPRDAEDLTFDAPWQARAFALTVALRRSEAFDWGRFQDRLIDAVADVETDDEATYYDAWLTAFERLLLDEHVLEADELAERVAAFERGDRDAGEFVVGDHGHEHAHDHGHEHSHDHPHGRSDGHSDDHDHGYGHEH